MGRLALLTCILALGAGTVSKTVYVRVKEANLLETPAADARVLKVLPYGSAVVWRGPVQGHRGYHHVLVDDLKGYMLERELAAARPVADPQAEAPVQVRMQPDGSLAVHEGPQAPGRADASAAARLRAIEELNDATATAAAIEAHAKAQKLVGR